MQGVRFRSSVMSWLVKQSRKRLKNGDVVGTAKTIAWSIRERYYEQRYDISSSAPVPVDKLGTDAATSEDYDPTSYLILRKIFRRLWNRRKVNDHAFLDAGCGKGRVTRVAAAYPYRKIIGIELSPELAQVARRNVRQCRERNGCRDIEILQANAAAFEIPDTVGTVFLYNPFRGVIMDSFMENLHRSVGRVPREIVLVFVNPIRFDANRYPWLQPIDEFHCFYPHYESHDMKVVMYSTTAAGSPAIDRSVSCPQ